MKKYFGILLSLIGLLGTSVFATYEGFSNQLKTMNLDVTTIEAASGVSRYDLARLLNSVECKDCIAPKQDMISKYVQSFWTTFTSIPGKDFADISYLGGIYNNTPYYYCVAYVGDNTYMRGYPKATSPVCGGKFCGTKNTNVAEFIQVVINILAKYVYQDIQLNRKEVNTRVNTLKADSYEAKNFNTTDRNLITEKLKTCDSTCALQQASEVNLYLKYCMFNIAKCKMQEFGKIKQGFWPVAELNLLYSQKIINIDQQKRRNIDQSMDGKTILDTLFKLNGKVDCSFNNDYDCDGILNAKDNAPNDYNPDQRDTNNDGIGDIMSDDIDGDGVKNPIGIVDNNGKINVKALVGWKGKLDNCLFTPNTDQVNTNKDGIGDVCDTVANQIGLYINIDKLEGSAPLTTTFDAISEGNITALSRDFGDGTQGKGTPITHTFLRPGMYSVQAIAKGNVNEAKAQVIVIVGGMLGDDKGLQGRTSIIGGKINTESTLSAMLLGNFDELEWIFPKENITSKKSATTSFKKVFKNEGENPVLVKGYTKGELTAISYFTIGIGEGAGAILRSDTSNPQVNEKILLDTNTYNITQADVLSVDRDFGDGIKKSNTALTTEYTYTQAGKRVIIQTITLTKGTKLINIITINIGDTSLLASYALVMIPSKLVASMGEKISFNNRIIGTLLKQPIIHIQDFADGITQKKAGTEKMPSIFVHSYQQDGMLRPQNSIYINQCTYLKSQATIQINGTDSCLLKRLEGTLNTIYKCDLDGDKIPDVCDDDIDGDGSKNSIGLIAFENKDCSIITNPTIPTPATNTNNPNINVNLALLKQQEQGICSLDNAPFSANPDQLDLNQDGIGDATQTANSIGNIQTSTGTGVDTMSNKEILDTDGDGIPNIQDICPTIQETWNGAQDEDGCPEVGQELGCNQQGIAPLLGVTNDILIVKPTTCNQCPCQFSDFASDLTNSDQVRAVLRDKQKTTQYKFSLPWIVDFQ